MILLCMIIMLLIYPLGASILGITGIVLKDNFRLLYAAGAAFSIAIIGFYFVPTHAIDLTRYYQIIEQYQYMMPTYADIVRSQGFFVGAGTLFKWVATLGNEQLLPAFVGFISSFSYFYISGDYFAFRKVAPLTRVYLLLIGLCLFPFAAAFSNVRNVTACTIVAIALYRDLVKKDRGIVTWCIYALGVSFHIAVLAILLMRVVLFFRQSQHIRVKLLSIIAILTGLAFPQIRNTLMQFFGKGGSYATLNEGAYVTDIGQSLFFWLTKVLFLGVTLVGFLVVMGNYKRNKSDWNFFALILSMCTLATFLITLPVYLRFLFTLLIILVPQLVDFIQSSPGSDGLSFLLMLMLMMAIAVLFFNIVTFNQYASFKDSAENLLIFSIKKLIGEI